MFIILTKLRKHLKFKEESNIMSKDYEKRDAQLEVQTRLANLLNFIFHVQAKHYKEK